MIQATTPRFSSATTPTPPAEGGGLVNRTVTGATSTMMDAGGVVADKAVEITARNMGIVADGTLSYLGKLAGKAVRIARNAAAATTVATTTFTGGAVALPHATTVLNPEAGIQESVQKGSTYAGIGGMISTGLAASSTAALGTLCLLQKKGSKKES
jgi:hypothetical protein